MFRISCLIISSPILSWYGGFIEDNGLLVTGMTEAKQAAFFHPGNHKGFWEIKEVKEYFSMISVLIDCFSSLLKRNDFNEKSALCLPNPRTVDVEVLETMPTSSVSVRFHIF